ncbi:hypothetical protein [Enorma phocaeensis]|uniref:hypothetical protein n=1 Tax=Enorma phocaeensis TaxID=1871019 RepID=UPI002352FE08|nr:hypothetical protein [Enorma phocaeensis]
MSITIPVILVAAIVCSGLAILPRERVISALEGAFGRRAVPLAYLRDFVMLCTVVVAAFLAIEWSWNDWLPFFERWKILLNGVPIATVLVALYLIGQRRGAPLAVGSVAALVIGLAQYFVLLCKGASIKPSDLFALNTALTVVGGVRVRGPDAPALLHRLDLLRGRAARLHATARG